MAQVEVRREGRGLFDSAFDRFAFDIVKRPGKLGYRCRNFGVDRLCLARHLFCPYPERIFRVPIFKYMWPYFFEEIPEWPIGLPGLPVNTPRRGPLGYHFVDGGEITNDQIIGYRLMRGLPLLGPRAFFLCG